MASSGVAVPVGLTACTARPAASPDPKGSDATTSGIGGGTLTISASQHSVESEEGFDSGGAEGSDLLL